VKVYFESLAAKELKEKANDSAITGSEQFGFKEGKGTTPCILKLLDQWS
jgi:hypothetical protein